MSAPSAIVFAYHDIGVRGVKVVLDAGIDVGLVVTHADDPRETIWFASVAEVARERGVRCVCPEDANEPAFVEECRSLAPDFLFSFYYRLMLKPSLLETARRGAYNMHGSLLPKYRGRAPVNWAVLHGERETGATLHLMDAKPDHGAIVDQCAVPILRNDTAREVFDKVTTAAEIVLHRSLPLLVAGTARLTPQDFSQSAYFGGRKPEDGRMPPAAGAAQLHNLIRAVAPPYPGAFFEAAGHRMIVERTLWAEDQGLTRPANKFSVEARGGALWIMAADGIALRILALRVDGQPCDAHRFVEIFGTAPLLPTE